MGLYGRGRKDEWLNKAYVMDLAQTREWVSADGKRQPIAGMKPQHIRNCIKYIERNDWPAGQMLIAVFEEELKRRGEDVPASMELEDRYRKLCGVARDMLAVLRVKDPVRGLKYKDILKSLGVDV